MGRKMHCKIDIEETCDTIYLVILYTDLWF
jgi:hypothetical protein